MTDYEYDLMLSYQSTDEELVRSLATVLEGERVDGRPLRVWFAPWDIAPGANIVQRVNEALAKSRFVALCLSPDSLNAPWPLAEQSAAIFTDPVGAEGRVIPLMLRDCHLPPLLRFRRYVDVRGTKFASGVQMLLAIVKDEPLPRGRASRWTEVDPPSRATARKLLAPTTADPLPETLYTNLFPLNEVPAKICCAETPYRWPKDLYKALPYGVCPPGFILHGGQLFTFSDLEDQANPLRPFVNANTFSWQATDDWLNDEDDQRRFIQLLNSTLNQHLKGKNWSHDAKGRKFFFREENVPAELKFKSHKGSTGKLLIHSYDEAFGGRGYKAHRATKPLFELIGFVPYLNMESGWVFTHDGRRPIDGRNRSVLNTRFMAKQKNRANLSEIRFMAWLMSDATGQIIIGSGQQRLVIGIDPVSFPVAHGIYGDQLEVSEAKEPPEFDVAKDEEDTEEEQELAEALEVA